MTGSATPPHPDSHETPADSYAPDSLTWLQAWYVTQCDGDWEHAHGVQIDTLDNPGWHLRVDLADTPLRTVSFSQIEVHRSEHDWLVLRRDDATFEAVCGPLNLNEAIHAFRLWATHHGEHAHNQR